MRCLVLGPTWWQRAAFSDLALFTNRVDVQVEVLVPQKCHLASLEMGQKSFLNYLHCQSRLLKIPKEFLNSQAARFLPVPSTFALRAEPCFFHTLLLPKAWTMPSSLHSCISVLLQTHKVGLGHVQTCPCFQVGGAIPFIYSPHWAATMPEPESLQQLFVIHTQCIQPLPSLPSSFWCDTYWQVQDLYASARICL